MSEPREADNDRVVPAIPDQDRREHEASPRERSERSERDGRPVCVLSVGRSGTSLATRAINLLGIDLGPESGLFGATEMNPRGFWEQEATLELNDRILAALGGTFWDPPSPAPGWEHRPEVAPLREALRAYVDGSFTKGRWGFKDPRTVWTLPLWRDVVGPMDYILCVRSPREAVGSLHHARPHEDPERLLALWLRQNAEALRQTRGRRRLVLAYDEWFEDGPRVVQRLHAFLNGPDAPLGDDVRREILSFFQPGLRRQDDGSLPQLELPVEVRAMDALLRLLAAVEPGAAAARPGEELAMSLDRTLEERRATEAAADAREAGLHAQLEQHRRWLEAVTSSASWRITAPLRAAKHRLQRGR
jgi:hypothetical protein